jgi:hypothetical protein
MNTYQEFREVGRKEAQSEWKLLSERLEGEALPEFAQEERVALQAALLVGLSDELNGSFRHLVELCVSIVGGQRRFAAALGKKETTVRSWRLARSNPSRSNIRTVAAFASGLSGKPIVKGRRDAACACDADLVQSP